jgi:hypothetical protein
VIRVTYRYLSGRPLDGRDGYPYLSAGNGTWPGWKRQVARIVVPALPAAALVEPHATAATAGAFALVGAQRLHKRWKQRRFTREYIDPTLAAIQVPLGNSPVKLHVDPALGSLRERLAKPPSQAEIDARRVYGARVQPVVRFPLDATIRGLWVAQKITRPVTGKLAYFRRPWEKKGPRVELTVETPYLTDDQRRLIESIIKHKIPVTDLQSSWNQVGMQVTGTWQVRKRPPAEVGYEDLADALPTLKEAEFYIGVGSSGRPVTASLDDDSPHMAVSAGSGAGKSVLAQAIAVQVLARGGQVTILDRKGSHRWALGLPGVDYCTRPEQMHPALLRLATVADERNTLSLHEDDGWDPGARHLVICEEMNATIGQLTNYWAQVRDKSEPKKSPAVTALAELLFMGRSAKVNVIGIAQMLTARAIGGPEARENFGIRFLARYTANNWKMLVPEAAMPRASRVRGRWQMVVGGAATEVQVVFLNRDEARLVASQPGERGKVPDGGLSSDVPGGQGHPDLLTLREACDSGVLTWSYEAAKKRLQRGVNEPPRPRSKRGFADLYRREDLVEWAGRR